MSDEVKENVEVSESQTESNTNTTNESQDKQPETTITRTELNSMFKGISEQFTNQLAAMQTDLIESITNILAGQNKPTNEPKVPGEKDNWI